jgi:hypothetical protein
MKKLAIILILIPLFSYAQYEKGVMVIFNTENDFLGINNKDENYTGAVKLEVQFPNPKKIIPQLRFKDSASTNIFRIGIGGTAYTPQSLELSEVSVGDRPYSSLVFINIGNTSFSKINKNRLQTDWIVGLMGTDILGNAQSHIHENHWFGSTRPVPLGWDNQIGYNKYLILNYNTVYEQNLTSLFDNLLIINGLGKVDLGNYMINVQTGLKLSFLNFNYDTMSENGTSIPKFYKPNISSPSKDDDTESEKKSKCIRFNIFAQPELRYAAFNATLEGRIFADSDKYTIASSDVKRFLFEINTGINLIVHDNVYINLSIAGRTQEFEGGKKFHSWGGFTIGFSPQKWYK